MIKSNRAATTASATRSMPVDVSPIWRKPRMRNWFRSKWIRFWMASLQALIHVLRIIEFGFTDFVERRLGERKDD